MNAVRFTLGDSGSHFTNTTENTTKIPVLQFRVFLKEIFSALQRRQFDQLAIDLEFFAHRKNFGA